MSTTTKHVILISGASSGFGEMAAYALARAGHTVYATMRSLADRRDKVDAYAERARAERLDLRTLEMDVGDQNSVDAAVARIVAEAGRLDVVVHNAGHMSFGPAEAFTAEQLAELYDVNALGTQRVNRAALPHLREQGRGLVLWVSSSSVRGNWAPYLAPYFAAKAGMEQLAISYAAELARFGIETSILVPGAFTQGTEHFAHSMKPGDAERARVYDEGPTAGLGDRILKAHEALEPADADPGEVAAAIVRIVDTPSGRRPFHVTIDPSQDGSEIVAAVQDRFRRDTLRRVGMEDLLAPSVGEAHAAGAGR